MFYSEGGGLSPTDDKLLLLSGHFGVQGRVTFFFAGRVYPITELLDCFVYSQWSRGQKMAKQHQGWRSRKSSGRNNPQKSTPITTGTYKRPARFHAQAMAHADPGARPQTERKPPIRDPRMGRSHKADSQACTQDRGARSGSDSNAHRHRKGL